MLLRCHVFELTPMRCHSFGEVFVALLSGRSCTCASAAPKFAMVDKYSSAGICRSLFPVMQGVSRYLDWQSIEFEENQANWSAPKMIHEASIGEWLVHLTRPADMKGWLEQGLVRFVGCHTSTFLMFSVKPEPLMSGCYVQPGNATSLSTQVILLRRQCRNWRKKQSSSAFSEAVSNHLGRVCSVGLTTFEVLAFWSNPFVRWKCAHYIQSWYSMNRLSVIFFNLGLAWPYFDCAESFSFPSLSLSL